MKNENPITNCVRMMALFAVVLTICSTPMYLLDFNIVDNLNRNMRFSGTILLDDAHGRRGRLAGRYSYSLSFPFEDRAAGVLRGEINAQ